MSRFSKFSLKNKIFMPFVTIGDPDFEKSFKIIETLIQNGADALELGFAFSDSMLDGEVIQRANLRVVKKDSVKKSFELLQKLRSKYTEIPISIMICANLVFNIGIDEFYKKCSDVSIDAVLIPDLPLFSAEQYIKCAKKYNISPIFICPVNADEESIQKIAKNSIDYIYLVSRNGVTSADNKTMSQNLKQIISILRKNKSSKILQGFGISNPDQAKQALKNDINGIISGSAFVKIIEENLNNHDACLKKIANFTKKMKKSMEG